MRNVAGFAMLTIWSTSSGIMSEALSGLLQDRTSALLRYSYMSASSRLLTTPLGRGNTMRMAMQVKIRIVGRKSGGEKWIEDACGMYEKRLRPSSIDVETIWHKNDGDLISGVNSDMNKKYSIVLLDPHGKSLTSESFALKLYSLLELGGSRIVFVIGGADGLPNGLKDVAYGAIDDGKERGIVHSLCLSKMTFTHQFSRAILMEQLYRAAEIRKGKALTHRNRISVL